MAHNITESETRRKLIDPQLAMAGWGHTDRRIIEEFFLSHNMRGIQEDVGEDREYKSEFSDYVLLDRLVTLRCPLVRFNNIGY